MSTLDYHVENPISEFTASPKQAISSFELITRETLNRFDRITRLHAFFHLFFIFLFLVQFFLLIIGFNTLVQSMFISMTLATIFLTVFAYFILKLYLNMRKPEELIEIKEAFYKKCETLINSKQSHYVSFSECLLKMLSLLEGREYEYYPSWKWLFFLKPTIAKFSCYWHWQDVHLFKEQLLLANIEEHIKYVKQAPTELEPHATLANAYIMLSSIYTDPKNQTDYDEDLWYPQNRKTLKMDQKFRYAAQRAIEELKILKDYAPNDPWIHAQLAYSYHDLKMPLEEIQEYEQIILLNPADKDSLFKLGMLYFEQGYNAKGLEVYEKLKKVGDKRTEDLISFYGAYTHHINELEN